MQRRYFLLSLMGLGGGAFGLSSLHWPDGHKLFNACKGKLPKHLAQHEVILSAFHDIDTTQVWDGHVHLVGLGDTDSGIWVNPSSLSLLDIKQYGQFRFYLNASCPTPKLPVDVGFIERLKSLQWGRGIKFVLLAFDYTYNEHGKRLTEKTAFYAPNSYAAKIHQQFPHTFEWLASIHPYRKDCVEALEAAFIKGARGVKWLPPAMGMNPASPLCDRFYKAMAHWDIPLLCHSGDEKAVHGTNTQTYGNPLNLRRALEHGVKVIIAHCGSLGKNIDTDKGKNGPLVSNFDLFTRLMDEGNNNLFGDISAITQTDRVFALKTLIKRTDWHSRLLYASDYPLPGIIPLVSLRQLQNQHYITEQQANILEQVRHYNPLLFDFVLKRHLKVDKQGFNKTVFHTRSLWTGTRIMN
ncbi:amidohydrolase family protein [Candidatus Halobeggiatoa sp. HSG11]|nr:amidohydrolase family protein [Candidatus Halobeggiatoa sp. HSG11]